MIKLSPIKCAAVKQDGKMWTGRNHAEIIFAMHKQGCPRVTSAQQGFVTEAGEFLSRKEAYERAIACEQIVDMPGSNRTLISEDLIRQ